MTSTDLWLEFVAIASVHFLAVASPGPDFAVVLKHSIAYGRRAAILTSIGIGLGILLHVSYSLLGIGILIKTTPWLYTGLTLAAAAYLFYIGFQAIRSKPPSTMSEDSNQEEGATTISDKKAFLVGFVTNGLNPKATLFFLSLFVLVIAPETPTTIKVGYGLYLSFATGLWFCCLSYFLGSKNVRQNLRKNGYWFDRAMGLVLIFLAISLVLDF